MSRNIITVICSLVVLAALAANTFAASIGVNFEGGGNGVGAISMASTDVAGVVPQANFNNEPGNSGTSVGLNDATGHSTTALLTYSASGTYSVGQASPVGGDQELNDGFIYGNGSVTVTGVPYHMYDVYVYELNDAAGRVETTTMGTTNYYGAAASPQDANHVSGSANTYLYTQSVQTNVAGTPTANGDYALFANVTGGSFTFTDSAPGNGYLNGFQIVQVVPEPSSVVLVCCGAVGAFVMAIRRRRAIAG